MILLLLFLLTAIRSIYRNEYKTFYIHNVASCDGVRDKEDVARLKYRAAENRETIYQLVCAHHLAGCSCHHIVVTQPNRCPWNDINHRFSFFFLRPPLRRCRRLSLRGSRLPLSDFRMETIFSLFSFGHFPPSPPSPTALLRCIRNKDEGRKKTVFIPYSHTSYHYITLVRECGCASVRVCLCVRFTSCRTGRRHYKKPQPVFRIRQMARGGVQDTVATNEIIAPAVHSACSSCD